MFNSFHVNQDFTVDKFENEVPHYLDIKMSAQGLTVYPKNTHSGQQYVHYDSFTPWNYKISWIRCLVTRAKRICSVNLLPEEINEIKKFASWNGFLKSISTSTIKSALNKSINEYHTDADNDIKFYLNLPYFGRAGEMLVKKCIRMLKKNIKRCQYFTFVVTYNTTKLSFYPYTKDCIDKLTHSFIAYKFCCPGCSKSYIGKTERTFFERINEHAFKDKNCVLYNHINNCDGVKYLVDLLN